MSFKPLHQFTITIDREVEEVKTRTEEGKEITEKTKRVQPVQVTIYLKDPSRREKQDLSLFRDIAYSEAINLGLLPKLIMTQKLSKDPSNALSGEGDLNLAQVQARLQELANDYIRLNAQSTSQTEEDEARKQKLSLEWSVLQKKATDMETAYQSVFAHTAEQYRDNKALMWLSLFLTYIKTGPDKQEPLFKGADFKAKEESLGELEDVKDAIYLGAAEKLSTYWMLWFFGRASTPEEFKKVEEQWNKELEAAKKLKEDAEAAALAEKEKVEVPVETNPETTTAPTT